MQESKNKILEHKEVRLVCVDKRYMGTPYKILPAFDDTINTYLTGQHVDARKPLTRDNLTTEEMRGEKILSEAKALKFPFVINPKDFVFVFNLQTLILSRYEDGTAVSPKDIAIFNFVRNYVPQVAPEKKDVNPGTHFFYIEDKEAEAKVYISQEDKIFEAEKLIRDQCTIGEYKDVIMLLNYHVQNFSLDVETSTDSRLKAELIKLCKKEPEAIISCFGDKAKQELYILKLLNNHIISKSDNSFYDGTFFIGDNLDEMRKFMDGTNETNQKYVSKWSKLLAQAEGRMPDSSALKSKTDNGGAPIDEVMVSLKKGTKATLLAYAVEKGLLTEEYETLNVEQLRQYVIDRYLNSKNS